MVLSGSLREFILADVFQLLTQQKITGKLHLNNNVEDGVIIFNQGAIVNAFKDTESFETKIESYLFDIKNVKVAKLKALFTAFKGDLQGLSDELLSQSLVTSEELTSLAESVIEDITCSLFLWDTGSYKFDSMRSVDKFTPAHIVIPIENITMEAMRRVDEWNRMKEAFNAETIFAPIDKTGPSTETTLDPIADPANYLYSKIDGTISVKNLIKETPLTQYKVYESIYALIQSKHITALSDKLTQAVQAAITKESTNIQKQSIPTLFSILGVVFFILFVVMASSIGLKGKLFSQKIINSYISQSESHRAITKEKVEISRIYLKSLGKNNQSEDLDSLIYLNLINKLDLKYIKE